MNTQPTWEEYAPPLKPAQFAHHIGVSVRTLQRWDREKILVAYRTPTNRRYYTYQQYLEYMGRTKEIQTGKREEASRDIVVVGRLHERLRDINKPRDAETEEALFYMARQVFEEYGYSLHKDGNRYYTVPLLPELATYTDNEEKRRNP
jgi:MerR family regulatory protein